MIEVHTLWREAPRAVLARAVLQVVDVRSVTRCPTLCAGLRTNFAGALNPRRPVDVKFVPDLQDSAICTDLLGEYLAHSDSCWLVSGIQVLWLPVVGRQLSVIERGAHLVDVRNGVE